MGPWGRTGAVSGFRDRPEDLRCGAPAGLSNQVEARGRLRSPRGKSLTLACLDRTVVEQNAEVNVYLLGEPRTARILPEAPYDPKGTNLRT